MPRKPDTSIIGQTFNNLRVVELTDQRNNYGRLLYRCECLLCGGERLATMSNLKRDEVKDCGCTKHNFKSDLTGQRFGKLLVTGSKIVNNQRRYICKCDCGKTSVVMPGDLKNGNTRSCGCGIGEKVKELYIDGTAPCKLDGSKLRANNRSGVTGVYWSSYHCAWVAEIMFKKKKYYLGRFQKIEKAIEVRKKAENRIFGEFLEWYEEYMAELNKP